MDQKYGGLPALASARPCRIAKKHAIAGWSTSLNFIGPVTELDGRLVRPHDLQLLVDPAPGSDEAVVERIVRLGFEVRVELSLGDGRPVSVQLPRSEAEQLELRRGDIVYVRSADQAAAAF